MVSLAVSSVFSFLKSKCDTQPQDCHDAARVLSQLLGAFPPQALLKESKQPLDDVEELLGALSSAGTSLGSSSNAGEQASGLKLLRESLSAQLAIGVARGSLPSVFRSLRASLKHTYDMSDPLVATSTAADPPITVPEIVQSLVRAVKKNTPRPFTAPDADSLVHSWPLASSSSLRDDLHAKGVETMVRRMLYVVCRVCASSSC